MIREAGRIGPTIGRPMRAQRSPSPYLPAP
jgi:hypothetical protein